MEDTMISKVVVSFRSQKTELPLHEGLTVGQVKSTVAAAADPNLKLTPQDMKLLYKGKVLSDRDQDISALLLLQGKKPMKVYRLMATGVSAAEAQVNNEEFAAGLAKAPRIRDDLSIAGQQEIAKRRQLGRKMMQKVASKGNSCTAYGFGRVDTLPMLPDQQKAREILTTLANDPGILACMANHKWNVGSLAELYPEGKVGESEVCVMGLNKNKGQQILLRIRTDDLNGFRKMLSIRKVLFHELAHNVHSEHDGDFFQLMRQIEKECNELDWTQGQGLSIFSDTESSAAFHGGTFRLGGGNGSSQQNNNLPVRELAARAAMLRLTAEEEEIYQHCGCGQGPPPTVMETEDQRRIVTTLQDMENDLDGEETKS